LYEGSDIYDLIRAAVVPSPAIFKKNISSCRPLTFISFYEKCSAVKKGEGIQFSVEQMKLVLL
jgi:hypothetical protein